MSDPLFLATGYFILKTATSLCLKIASNDSDRLADKLIEAAGGNFYYDLLKVGGQKAWTGITSRMRSEYNSNEPLNHDLQKAIRKSQIEATLSACESCFDDLKLKDKTLVERVRDKISLNDEEKWLKIVIQSLTKNLAEIKHKDYVPPTLTDEDDVLQLANTKDFSPTDENLQNLISSLKEQTIIEIRFANPPDFSQNQIASLLESKIYKGWTKEFQGETIEVDWYKLLCDRFNEAYKENDRVKASLQKLFFQDIKSDIAQKFNNSNITENHFEELGGNILSKLEIIEGKQDRLYEFVVLFSDETDKKLTEALVILRTSVSEINKFAEEKAKENQDVTREIGDKVIEANKEESDRLFDRFDKRLDAFTDDVQINVEAKLKEIKEEVAKFRRSRFAERDLTVIERLFGNKRFGFFNRIFGKLTPQEQFFVSLRERYAERYYSKLDGRFEITLQATNDLTTQEFKGIYEGSGHLKEAFEFMRNSFKDSNRLIVLGEPGVGKTVLLLKFANDLLKKTQEKLEEKPNLRLDDSKDPIPVVFNLASWSEDYKYFKDWLIEMLKTGEGLSEDFADELLSNGKIFLLLDGLDELAKNEEPEKAAEIRAKCFNSIKGFLKRGQKAIICCRVDEYRQIRKEIGQDIEDERIKIPEVLIKTLTKEQIKDALKRATLSETDKDSANNLLSILNGTENESLYKVLSIPFYFSTALEIFEDRHLQNTNLSNDKQDLKNYLLQNYIVEKLEKIPDKEKKFSFRKSLKWLKWLALHLKKNDNVIFELANLQPTDFRLSSIYKLFFGFITCIIIGMSFALTLISFGILTNNDSINQFRDDLGMYFASKLLATIMAYIVFFFGLTMIACIIFFPFCILFGFRIKYILTEDTNHFSFKPLLNKEVTKKILLSGFWYGLFAFPLSLLTLFGSQHSLKGSEIHQMIAVIIMVFFAVIIERITNYCRIIKKYTHLEKPYQRIKAGFMFNFTRWNIITVFFLILLFNLIDYFVRINHTFNWLYALWILPITLPVSLVNTPLIQHLVLRTFLALFSFMPLKFATFLHYTSVVNILEESGGFWRFRHQELQDYFAKLP